MKIAAIDLGSNSIHLVIVEVGPAGAFRVVDRETEMVRLGSGTLSTGSLPAAAIERALGILVAYQRLAELHGVETIVAVATSAVREASNGEELLDRISRKTGIYPRVLPGEEEGRLIYLAALHSIHFPGRRALVVDLGGGSLELVLGRGPAVHLAVSEKLGILRMAERFVRTDPIAPREESRLAAHVEAILEPDVRRIRRRGFDVLVGSSGTILALGRLAYEQETGRRPDSLHHVTVQASTLHAVRRRLCRLDLRGRLKLPGLDLRRADVIAAGAVILDTMLAALGAKRIVLCEWALREGILLDYIRSHQAKIARAEAYPDVRRRSVLELAERCQYDEPHARQVAALALALFDATKRRHGLGPDARSLLEYAALLHDVGHHISHASHHKHTSYLIKHGRLTGFDPLEIDVIACTARYHRRGQPRRKHVPFASLPKKERAQVRVLAGLLRLADGLDRSHRQTVRSLEVSFAGRTLSIRCRARGDTELELWGARKRIDLLSEAFGLPISVDLARDRARVRPRAVRAATPRDPVPHGPARGAALEPAHKRRGGRDGALKARRPATADTVAGARARTVAPAAIRAASPTPSASEVGTRSAGKTSAPFRYPRGARR